jgi:class 3 adenylate cyclase
VKLLDEYFRGFDEITTRFGIEKIKTMGDAYMCTGGLPDPAVGTPAETLRTALAMRNLVTEMGERKSAAGEPYFNCRIGLHTGPVVAGIVGQKKFVYDIWGDTVNTATRMEQYGAVGEVNLSSTTQQLLADDEQFQFEYRGEIEVKGKGKIGMYFAR